MGCVIVLADLMIRGGVTGSCCILALCGGAALSPLTGRGTTYAVEASPDQSLCPCSCALGLLCLPVIPFSWNCYDSALLPAQEGRTQCRMPRSLELSQQCRIPCLKVQPWSDPNLHPGGATGH